MTNNVTALAHSDVMGGSSAERRIMCPLSLKLEQKMPRDEGSDFAKEGTAFHFAMEYLLLEHDINVDPTIVVGKTFNDIVITEESVDEKIRPALEAFKEVCAMYPGELDYFVEFTGNINEFVPGAFGTVDILGRFKDGPLLILDWKFGDGVIVDVEANIQLAFYAACALYDEDPDAQKIIDTGNDDIVFAIVQPVRDSENPTYSVWELDREWIEDFVDIAAKSHILAKKPKPPAKVGKHCMWCKAKAACPEKQKVAVNALSVKPKSMDIISLSKHAAMTKEIKKWAEDVEALVLLELKRGVKVPGFKLVNKQAKRVFADKKIAEEILDRELEDGAFKPQEMLSVNQAEKFLKKKKFDELLGDEVVWVTPEGVTCAKDTDKREDIGESLAILGTVKNTKMTLTRKK